MPTATGSLLNAVVIHVSLPALILLNLPKLTISGAALVPVVMPWLMLGLSAWAVAAIARARRWDRATTGCLLLLVPLGNTSFVGIPMVKALLGEWAVPFALLYDQLGSFPALAIYGSLIASTYGSGEARPTVSAVARSVVVFPPFLAFVAALALRSWEYPEAVVAGLSVLAATLVPLVMIAVGFQMELRMGKEEAGRLGVGLAIKMVAAPLAALAICRAAGFSGPAAEVAVFDAGMPPMVSAGALAIAAGLAPSLAAALVGFGIIASFITLPLLRALL